MKTIKQVITTEFTLTLYEVKNQFIVLRSGKGQEVPSIPSDDLSMALAIFDVWLTELEDKDTRNLQ